MEPLEALREKFQNISRGNERSLNKRRRPPALNRSDEQLAIRQSLPKTDISDVEQQTILEGLRSYSEVVAYYQKRLPIEVNEWPDHTKYIAELCLKYSNKPAHVAVVSVLQDYLRRQIETGMLESDLLSDRNRLVQAIQYVMTKSLREPHKI